MKRKHRHASVEEHPKGSGKWRVRARIGGKLAKVASGLTKANAEAVADTYAQLRLDADLQHGITVTQHGVGFLDRRELSGVRSIREDRNRWKLYVDGDLLGGISLAGLRRADVVEWRDRLLARGLARQTVKNALNLLRSGLADALDRELCERNMAADVTVPRRAGRKPSKEDLEGIMLPEEQAAVLEAVPEREQPMVIVALLTGLRWSELSWLRWEDVGDDVIVVRRSRGGGPTKSGKARRVPLLPAARVALEVQRAGRRKRCPWVFPGRHGDPRTTRPSPWPRWVAASGIGRPIRWHDLRHTCATALLAGWWSETGERWTLDEVCKMLGHSSIHITERYAKKLDETLAQAAGRMFPGGNGNGGSPGYPSVASVFLNRWSAVRISPGAQHKNRGKRDPSGVALGTVRELPAHGVRRKVLALSAVDPDAAKPGLAAIRGLDSALKGDEPATLAALRDGAEALAGRPR